LYHNAGCKKHKIQEVVARKNYITSVYMLIWFMFNSGR